MKGDADLIDMLRSAGVPSRYHAPKLRLDDYRPVGPALSEWVNGKTLDGSVFICGRNDLTRSAFYLAAKGHVNHKRSVQITHLPILRHEVKTAFFGAYEDVRLLCIPNFYDPHFKQPLPEEDIMLIECFLRVRMENGMEVMLQAPVPLKECKWWSPQFLSFLRYEGIMEVEE